MNTIKHFVKKVKINPSKSQKETFDFWLRRCKILYNTALEEKNIYYKSTGKYLNVYDQKKELVDIKNYDKSWKDIPNKSLQEIIFRVDNSYQKFFKGSGFPKFKSKLNSIEFVKTDVKLKQGKLYLPKIKEEIKTYEEIKIGWTSVRLIKENNNFYLSFLYKQEVKANPDNQDVLGIDLGLMSLYTDSNGIKCKRFSKKLIKKYQDRIVLLSKSLTKKKKGSLKFKKIKKQLNNTYNRLKRTKNDFLHKESLKLVKNKEGIIALGDIKIKSIIDNNKGNKSKKGLVKSFYINSIGIFKQMVSYKSIKYNKICLIVDERNTSKTCSCCGNVNYSLKLSDRIYKCIKCKNSVDRDLNSAINMKLLGSSMLSNLDNVVHLINE